MNPGGTTSGPAAPTSVRVNHAPTVPRGLHATGVTAASVGLAWRRSRARKGHGKLRYLVYRDGREIGTSDHTAFVDHHVRAATKYGYTVRAVDAKHKRSRRSRALFVRTPAVAVTSSGGPRAAPPGPGPAAGPPPMTQPQVDQL